MCGVRLTFESWLAWEGTGFKGATVGAYARQLRTSHQVVLNLLKAGRLDEVRIYECGKLVATLVKCHFGASAA